MGALLGSRGVILHGEGLALTLGIVGDRQLHGVQNRHGALGVGVEILAEAELQSAVLNDAGGLTHADHLAEIADGAGGIATAAQAAQGRHTGIVPAGDAALLHQLAELTLGHDGMVDAEAGELDLTGLVIGDGDVVHHPVIQGTMILILQGAEAVGDALKGILNGMGKVVHGEHAPARALTMMLNETNTVDDGVAHVEVAGGKVNLGAEGHLALLHLTGDHLLEERTGLFNGTVTVGGHGGDTHIAAVGAELLGRQLTDIGQALVDQLEGVLQGLFKIIGAIVETVAPVEAQPVDILLNGIHVLGVLLGGVGIVHTQVAQSAVLLGSAEVDAQSLAVADMEIAVRLGRETGVNSHTLELTTLCDVLVDKIMNEVFALGNLHGLGGLHFLGHSLTLLVSMIVLP